MDRGLGRTRGAIPEGWMAVPVAAVAQVIDSELLSARRERLAAAAPLGPDGAGARADEDAGDDEGAARRPRLDGAPRSCSFVRERER